LNILPDKRDFYDVLGVPRNASQDDLKKAFRKQAKASHPDAHPGDKAAEQRFKEVNEAYEVLSDGEKKARYDQFGHAGVDPSYGAGQPGGGFGGGFSGFGDFGDLGSIFESVFGFGGQDTRRSGPRKGESLKVSLTLPFEEAVFGCQREIDVARVEPCDRCEGTGAAPGTNPETCSACKGSGQTRITRRTPLGQITQSAPCAQCGGSGKHIRNPCADCGGAAYNRRTRRVTVDVPAGIDDGQTLQLRGQGNAGQRGGSPGDLLVSIRVKPHAFLERDGTTLHCEFPVSFTQAALGAELEVPTIDGKVKYSLPAGTQTGTVFRLRGQGVPSLRSRSRGDQLVRVRVDVPTGLTSAQKELLQAFADSLEGKKEPAKPEKKSMFGKKK
jgi:molecular chaperone DnaJ